MFPKFHSLVFSLSVPMYSLPVPLLPKAPFCLKHLFLVLFSAELCFLEEGLHRCHTGFPAHPLTPSSAPS